MHTISKHAIVAYSTEKMYRLVNDVKSYPEFLAWCTNSQIISEQGNEVHASISATKGPFNQTFSTKNTLLAPEQITIELLDGPFKHLCGTWRFVPLSDEACKIYFDLEFGFATKLLDIALSPYFRKITEQQLDAFITRAKAVYG